MIRCLSIVVVLFCATALTACCGGLIPNYEVLPVPADENRFPVGAQWNPLIGAPVGAGAPAEKVKVAKGTESIHTSVDKNRVDLSLSVPLIKWISGSLGYSSDEIVDLKASDLEHRFLVDTAYLTSTRPILFETISATNLNFTISSKRGANLDLQGDASKLAKSVGSGTQIQLKVDVARNDAYTMTSNRRLVIAIRVAGSEQALGSGRSTIDLTAVRRGSLQENGAFGYRFTVQDVDPIKMDAKVLIENPYLPKWDGQAVTFTSGVPFWSNERRDSIQHPNDTVSQRDYIWDRLRLGWNQNLQACELIVDRQYQILVNQRSGISGTR